MAALLTLAVLAALYAAVVQIRRDAHATRAGLASGRREANWLVRRLGIERATDLKFAGAVFGAVSGAPFVSDRYVTERALSALVGLVLLAWTHWRAANHNERLIGKPVP